MSASASLAVIMPSRGGSAQWEVGEDKAMRIGSICICAQIFPHSGPPMPPPPWLPSHNSLSLMRIKAVTPAPAPTPALAPISSFSLSSYGRSGSPLGSGAFVGHHCRITVVALLYWVGSLLLHSKSGSRYNSNKKFWNLIVNNDPINQCAHFESIRL